MINQYIYIIKSMEKTIAGLSSLYSSHIYFSNRGLIIFYLKLSRYFILLHQVAQVYKIQVVWFRDLQVTFIFVPFLLKTLSLVLSIVKKIGCIVQLVITRIIPFAVSYCIWCTPVISKTYKYTVFLWNTTLLNYVEGRSQNVPSSVLLVQVWGVSLTSRNKEYRSWYLQFLLCQK